MRTAGDIPMGGGFQMPPVGDYECRCTETRRWKSPKKGTPAVKLIWATQSGDMFDDSLFVTGKALSRLNLVAQRVCGMEAEHALPDDDGECAIELAKYIMANAQGKYAIVTIEEQPETIFHQDGPKVGQKETVMRRRVAFAGYRAVPQEGEDTINEKLDTASEADKDEKGEDDMPF